MASLDDLRAAKTVLSRKWLKRHLRRAPLLAGRRLTLADAVAAAGNGVHGVGIGYRRVNGNATKTRAVQLFVEQKLPKSLLAARDLIPASLDGVPVDVVELRPAVATGGRRRRSRVRAESAVSPMSTADSLLTDMSPTRPIRPGVSAAHVLVTVGTLGCLCRFNDAAQPGVLALSANHVFAACNQAQIDDDLQQPSPGDFSGNASVSHFGDLAAFQALVFSGVNRIDAAVGRLLPGVTFDPSIPGVGHPIGVGIARLDQAVCKVGRTTGYTEGVVRNVFYDTNVTYIVNGQTLTASFRDQLRIEPAAPFSRWTGPGDSGALVAAMPMNGTTQGLGLHFSGADDGSYGVACQIAVVFELLKIGFL